MLTHARLSQLFVEVVFLLLGLLVMFLGWSGRIFLYAPGRAWLLLSFVLIALGLLALARPGQWWARWQKWNRGVSLLLLGLIMLAITRVPFGWVGHLLIAAGAVLLLRGLFGALLIFRQR